MACAKTLASHSQCTVPEIQAVLGHRTPHMALHYAKEANKRILAESGMRKRERAGAA